MSKGVRDRAELESLARILGVPKASTVGCTANELRGLLAKELKAVLERRGVREGVTIKYAGNAPKWRNMSFPVISTEVRWRENIDPQIELNKQGQYYSAMLVLNYATVV